MHYPGFAVIDFETTGVVPERNDRIVEIGVVHVSPTGELEGEWETVLNPGRDLGPTHIHGLRGSDVMNAPTFADIAPEFLGLLAGRILVAHNAVFEARFLRAELARLGLESPAENTAVLDTMRLAPEFAPGIGRSLRDCCDAYGIPLIDAHEALADAHATAVLLRRFLQQNPSAAVWFQAAEIAQSWRWPSVPAAGVPWFRRPRRDTSTDGFVTRTVSQLAPVPTRSGHELAWLGLLDGVMADGVLSPEEIRSLDESASSLGLDAARIEDLIREWFASFVDRAWADGVLTPEEQNDIRKVAFLLLRSEQDLTTALSPRSAPAIPDEPSSSDTPDLDVLLVQGARVVFTGDGGRPRGEYFSLAERVGLEPFTGVSKKVAVLFAIDPTSLSGKARKARDYGIPVIDVTHFETWAAGRL